MAAVAAAKRQNEQLTAGQARVKAMSHPLRERIYRHWIEHGVMAPVEVSNALLLDLTAVSYHARVLKEIGCLEEVGTEPVRGSTKHYLRATDRHVVDQPEWADLEPIARDGVVAGSIKPLIDDFERAHGEGTFRRPQGDFHLTRIPLKGMDRQGFEELLKAHMDLYDLSYEIEKRSAERMTASGEEPIRVSTGQTCWQVSSF